MPTQPSEISVHHITADGVDIFFREAGSPQAPVLLLLHGFPSSSFMFRNLIPLLADRYHVVAPDYPGFGFTEVPEERRYVYTFESLTATMTAFTEALGLSRYILYVFDYGAPIGFRMAMAHPERVLAIVSQNGNVYDEGLGEVWAPTRLFWENPDEENRAIIGKKYTLEATRKQYRLGEPQPDSVAPEGYTLDAALMQRPGNQEIQFALTFDYQNNVHMYPKFQQYIRAHLPPILAVWGKNDVSFIPPGAQAFLRDNPSTEVELLDAGHFAAVTHAEQIAASMQHFLGRLL